MPALARTVRRTLRAVSPRRTTWIATAAIMAGVAILYVACAKLGLALAFRAAQVSAVWPPTGFALAATVLLGRRAIPGILLGAFAANATAGEPAWVAAGIAIGNTLEAVAGAAILRRFRFDAALARLRDVLSLFARSPSHRSSARQSAWVRRCAPVACGAEHGGRVDRRIDRVRAGGQSRARVRGGVRRASAQAGRPAAGAGGGAAGAEGDGVRRFGRGGYELKRVVLSFLHGCHRVRAGRALAHHPIGWCVGAAGIRRRHADRRGIGRGCSRLSQDAPAASFVMTTCRGSTDARRSPCPLT